MDPQFAQEAATQAQLVAGGTVGATTSVYLKHPGNTIKAVLQGVVSIMLASAFGTTAHHYLSALGFNLTASGAVVGLTGLGLAGGLMKAASRFDFMAFFPKQKEG